MPEARYNHGLVIGKFYPPHRGHAELIKAAAASCKLVTVGVFPSEIESIPLAARIECLRQEFKNSPHIHICGAMDNVEVNYSDPNIWDKHMAVFNEAIGVYWKQKAPELSPPPIEALFSSENYGDELARRFNAAHLRVNRENTSHPTGTEIRRNPLRHWVSILAGIRPWFCKRIVVVGAESTGTTTLTKALAEHFRGKGGVFSKTSWVPEYGREHTAKKIDLLKNSTLQSSPAPTIFDLIWEEQDFITIAKQQTEWENAAALDSGPLLFVDTDALATSIWHERYRGSISPTVNELSHALPPRSLYLLTDFADVPFEQDGYRDGEHLRDWMTKRFEAELAARNQPWIKLSGTHEVRLSRAIKEVERLLEQGWFMAVPLTDGVPDPAK